MSRVPTVPVSLFVIVHHPTPYYQAEKATTATAMESGAAVGTLLASGKAAIATGDRAAASQQLHEATKVCDVRQD